MEKVTDALYARVNECAGPLLGSSSGTRLTADKMCRFNHGSLHEAPHRAVSGEGGGCETNGSLGRSTSRGRRPHPCRCHEVIAHGAPECARNYHIMLRTLASHPSFRSHVPQVVGWARAWVISTALLAMTSCLRDRYNSRIQPPLHRFALSFRALLRGSTNSGGLHRIAMYDILDILFQGAQRGWCLFSLIFHPSPPWWRERVCSREASVMLFPGTAAASIDLLLTLLCTFSARWIQIRNALFVAGTTLVVDGYRGIARGRTSATVG